MASIAIVYHSGYGHTERVAERIATGARSIEDTRVRVITAEELNASGPNEDEQGLWAALQAVDGMILGCPTYMGTVSAELKRFMDASGATWYRRKWAGKLCAGFTNSGGLSGDKLNVLTTLAIFAAQHGMLWAPCDVQEEPGSGINRLGSYLGLMTQADNGPPDETPPPEDLKTAGLFGKRIAEILARWSASGPPS